MVPRCKHRCTEQQPFFPAADIREFATSDFWTQDGRQSQHSLEEKWQDDQSLSHLHASEKKFYPS